MKLYRSIEFFYGEHEKCFPLKIKVACKKLVNIAELELIYNFL